MHAKQDPTSLHKRFLNLFKRNLADVGPELANAMLQHKQDIWPVA